MEAAARATGQAHAQFGDLFLTVFPMGPKFSYRLNGQEVADRTAQANLDYMLRRAA
jgi:hypothetical protein